MKCRPMWPFLLMCVSCDARRIDFPQVDGWSTDTPVLGRHNFYHDLYDHVLSIARISIHVIIFHIAIIFIIIL